MTPPLRRATTADIDRLMALRAAVRENRLADPAAVTRADYAWFVGQRLVWVWAEDDALHGFAAGDPRDGWLWALFVSPDAEGRGIGRALLAAACADLAEAGWTRATLSTDPGTRAERLYRRLGWQDEGRTAGGEVRFGLALTPPASAG